MDNDGIHVLVIEVIDHDTVDNRRRIPVYLHVILGKDLILGLRHLIAYPFQPIRACSPVGMQWVPRGNVHVGCPVGFLCKECSSCDPSTDCSVPGELVTKRWKHQSTQSLIGSTIDADKEPFFQVIAFSEVRIRAIVWDTDGHIGARHPSDDFIRVCLGIIGRIGLVSLTGIIWFKPVEGVIVLHPLSERFSYVIMRVYERNNVFWLSSCHLCPPFDSNMLHILDISVPKTINKAVDNRFYPMIVLVFWNFANNISISVGFPAVCTALTIERIGC